MGIKKESFILENPRSESPISSGKGEAIMRAPMTGVMKRKILPVQMPAILFVFELQTIFLASITMVSLTKEKIKRSPITAPTPPTRATGIIDELSVAIFPRTRIAGAVVRKEVKKRPATKDPRSLVDWVPFIITSKAPPSFNKKATKMLATTARVFLPS